jgi:hypothetical protein
MTLFSRISKDCQNAFEINLILPTIKKMTDSNEWTSDPRDPEKCINIEFNTQFLYKKDSTFWCLVLTIFGFGFTITKQSGY